MEKEDISKSLQWISYKLNREIKQFEELATGTIFVELISIITEQKLNYSQNPKNVFQKIENFSVVINQIRQRFKHDCTENIMRMVSGDANELKKMTLTIHRVCTHQTKLTTRNILQSLRAKSLMKENDDKELMRSFAKRRTLTSTLKEESCINDEEHVVVQMELSKTQIGEMKHVMKDLNVNNVKIFDTPSKKNDLNRKICKKKMTKSEIKRETSKFEEKHKKTKEKELYVEKMIEFKEVVLNFIEDKEIVHIEPKVQHVIEQKEEIQENLETIIQKEIEELEKFDDIDDINLDESKQETNEKQFKSEIIETVKEETNEKLFQSDIIETIKEDIIEDVKEEIKQEIIEETIKQDISEEQKEETIKQDIIEEIKEEIKQDISEEQKEENIKQDIIEENNQIQKEEKIIERIKTPEIKQEINDSQEIIEIKEISELINEQTADIKIESSEESNEEEIPIKKEKEKEHRSKTQKIETKKHSKHQSPELRTVLSSPSLSSPSLSETTCEQDIEIYRRSKELPETNKSNEIKELKNSKEKHPGQTQVIISDEISPKSKIKKRKLKKSKDSSSRVSSQNDSIEKIPIQPKTIKEYSITEPIDSNMSLSEISQSTESLEDSIVDAMNSLIPNNQANKDESTTEEEECRGLFRPGLEIKIFGENKKMKSGIGIEFKKTLESSAVTESGKRSSSRTSGVLELNEVKEIIKTVDASRTEDASKLSEMSTEQNTPCIDEKEKDVEIIKLKGKKHTRKQSPKPKKMKQIMTPKKPVEHLRMTLAPSGKHFDQRSTMVLKPSKRRSKRISVVYEVDQIERAMKEQKDWSFKQYEEKDIQKIELIQWYIQQREIARSEAKMLKKMKERKGAIMELLNNEIHFLKNMTLLSEALKILIQHNCGEIFKFASDYLDRLILTTNQLKSKLEDIVMKQKEVYGNGIAEPFIELFPKFIEYSYFINMYKPLMSEYEEIMKKQEKKTAVYEYFYQLKVNKQTDLDSLSSMPFQHIMRYKIQINRILETFPIHDKRKILFEKANQIISDVIATVNNQYKNFSQSSELDNINEKMSIKLKRTIIGRKIISVQNMDICKIKNKDIYKGKCKNKSKKYCVLILSDAIVLMTNKTLIERDVVTVEHLVRKTKIDVESILYLDSIQIMQFDSKTIHISDSSDYLIRFATTASKVKFVLEIENTRSQLWSNYISILKSIKGDKTYSYFSQNVEDISFHADICIEEHKVVHMVLVGIYLFIYKSVSGFVKKKKPLFLFNIFETQIDLQMHNDNIITFISLKQENKSVQLQLQTLDMALFWINTIRVEMQKYLSLNRQFVPIQTRQPKVIHPWYIWQLIPNINGNERCLECNHYSSLVDLETGKFYCEHCVKKSNKCYMKTSSSALSLLALATTEPQLLMSQGNNICKALLKKKKDKKE